MAGGYKPEPQGDLAWLVDELRGIRDRLAELETPTGTSMNSLVAQVQEAIANIDATVTASINANSYTKSEIDSRDALRVAKAGDTMSGSLTVNGQVDSAGSPLKSQPSYNYMVATGYKGAWIDGATYQIGYSPSAEVVKTDLTPMDDDAVRRLLSIVPFWGRYLWDADDSEPKAFLLAADVQRAGFGPDVAPVVEGEPLRMVNADGPVLDANGDEVVLPVGEAYSVNYSQLVVPLLAAVRSLSARLDAAGL